MMHVGHSITTTTWQRMNDQGTLSNQQQRNNASQDGESKMCRGMPSVVFGLGGLTTIMHTRHADGIKDVDIIQITRN
jgi:hypothetical protein